MLERIEDKIILTGIKPTGILHLGNYIGAIKPLLELSQMAKESFVFIADYHALNAVKDSKNLKNFSTNIAAAWISLGLDYRKTVFYRQSMVPEIFELGVILSAFTPKGFMNKAHAYKAIVEKNQENGDPPDNGVNMGLYTYPILMAADILAFKADYVPIGPDQIQHLEIARDIATIFNSHYNTKTFKLPDYLIQENTSVVPGLDGRKMSKSYNNIIPLFSSPEELRKAISKIKTDSAAAGEKKDPNNSTIMILYQNFASATDAEELKKRFIQGKVSYKEAKDLLFEAIEKSMHEARIRYHDLVNDERSIEKILNEGSEKARFLANVTLREIRKVIGVI